MSYIAASDPIKGATVISRFNSDIDNAWNSILEFENGIVGIIKANYQTGSRVHTFEIHGPFASAYINIGFGEPCCDATVFINEGSGSFSLSSAGTGSFTTEHYDGHKLAGSDEYHKSKPRVLILPHGKICSPCCCNSSLSTFIHNVSQFC